MAARTASIVAGIALLASLAATVVAFPGRGAQAAFAQADRSLQSLPAGWTPGPSFPYGFVPRWDFAADYFPPAGQLVVFGGSPMNRGQSWEDDTWILQNGSWRKGPAAPPDLSPRGGAALAYMPSIGKVVMWGGSGPEWPPHNSRTWLWDGAHWSAGPFAPGTMEPRVGARMVFDPDINRLVLFGGSGVDAYTDTWLFDGTTWTPGPATPQRMHPRVFFGMAYDPDLHRVIVLGGDGANDVWCFDGSQWTAGPSLPADFHGQDRLEVAYDPDLHATMVFGGIGSGMARGDLWMLQGGSWYLVPHHGNPPRPAPRADGAIVWLPGLDAFMVFGGIRSVDPGNAGFTDSWFFREIPPQLSSVTLSPLSPHLGQNVHALLGSITGGYGHLTSHFTWLINGAPVPGQDSPALPSSFLHVADRIQVNVQITDDVNMSTPVLSAGPIQVADRPPKVQTGYITPNPAYAGDKLTAGVLSKSDPDGDKITLHFQWEVNGQPVSGNDIRTLTADHFQAGDVVTALITPVDQWGTPGNTVSPTVHIHPR